MTANEIVLRGGPELAATAVPEVVDLDDKVKVRFASGYEHFEHNGAFQLVEGVSRPVFQWCGRTKVAE